MLEATVADFVLLFQNDLRNIFEAFRSYLNVDVTDNRFVPNPGKGKCLMTRFDSQVADPASGVSNYTFQIVMGRAGNITAQTHTPSTFSVEYTYERVMRLLQANGNFGRHAGISRLVGIEGGISPPGANLVLTGKNVEEAIMAVTYARDEAVLFKSNR
ncbi:MAG: hypothetical protein KDB65_10645 [Calditrichaeota bacterium]|nr:hypothetical protein [Calditrichota bacterium]